MSWLGFVGSSPATLRVSTDKASYRAGDRVNGTVYLQVSKEINASSLQLCITGEEVARVVLYSTREQEQRHDESRRNIFFLCVNLAEFAYCKLDCGHYEFPFAADLAPWLPSSMRCETDESVCEVRYRIDVYLLHEYVGSELSKLPTVRSSLRLGVRALSMISEEKCSTVIHPWETQAVNFLLCLKWGFIAISAELDRSIANRGEMVRVGFSLRNQSSVTIKGVRIRLVEHIRWNSGHSHTKSAKTIAEKWIPPGTIKRISMRVYEGQARAVDPAAWSTEPHMQLVSLVVPAHARDSYDGRIVHVSHEVTIKFKTPFGFTPSPAVRMEIKVVSPSSKHANQHTTTFLEDSLLQYPPINSEFYENGNSLFNERFVVPSDWSPDVAAIVVLPMDQAIIGGDEVEMF